MRRQRGLVGGLLLKRIRRLSLVERPETLGASLLDRLERWRLTAAVSTRQALWMDGDVQDVGRAIYLSTRLPESQPAG
jgi:hypothetical protein